MQIKPNFAEMSIFFFFGESYGHVDRFQESIYMAILVWSKE